MTPELAKQESILLDYIDCDMHGERPEHVINVILDRVGKYPGILTEQVMLDLAKKKPWVFAQLLSVNGDWFEYMLEDGPESPGWPIVAALTETVLVTAAENMEGFMLMDPALFIQHLYNMGVEREWVERTFTPAAIKAIMKDCKETHIWRNLEAMNNNE